jgi:hypothetical protein
MPAEAFRKIDDALGAALRVMLEETDGLDPKTRELQQKLMTLRLAIANHGVKLQRGELPERRLPLGPPRRR